MIVGEKRSQYLLSSVIHEPMTKVNSLTISFSRVSMANCYEMLQSEINFSDWKRSSRFVLSEI